MKKVLLLITFLMLVFVVIGAVGCGSYFGSEDSEAVGSISSQQNIGIWVIGVGEIPVVPDIAILSIGIQAQKDTVAEAQQAAVEAMNGVMGVLDTYDIEEEDIQTQQFSIQPVYRWDNGEQTLLGYSVTNIATVRIRDIDDAGSIIDAAVDAGGNYTRVNSISFTMDKPEAYYEDARQKAMEDAGAKATQLAELGEVELGKPTYINEYSGLVPPIIYRDFNEGAPTTAETIISPGEIEIQLTVEVHYNIK
jgi:uncharacterized protein YggE